MTNRGARGWEPPQRPTPVQEGDTYYSFGGRPSVVLVDPAEMRRRQIEAQAKQDQWMREQEALVMSYSTLNGCVFVESEDRVIDMVQVNGVWMVPEAAK